ncbi:MAG: hypothetical protein ACK5XN_35315, partial [Bacteroidota bacterium]
TQHPPSSQLETPYKKMTEPNTKNHESDSHTSERACDALPTLDIRFQTGYFGNIFFNFSEIIFPIELGALTPRSTTSSRWKSAWKRPKEVTRSTNEPKDVGELKCES